MKISFVSSLRLFWQNIELIKMIDRSIIIIHWFAADRTIEKEISIRISSIDLDQRSLEAFSDFSPSLATDSINLRMNIHSGSAFHPMWNRWRKISDWQRKKNEEKGASLSRSFLFPDVYHLCHWHFILPRIHFDNQFLLSMDHWRKLSRWWTEHIHFTRKSTHRSSFSDYHHFDNRPLVKQRVSDGTLDQHSLRTKKTFSPVRETQTTSTFSEQR